MTYDAAAGRRARDAGRPGLPREGVRRDARPCAATSASTAAGAGMKVVVDQTQPADGIPSFAKKFVGDEIQIVQRETVDGAAAGATLIVEIPGKPGDSRARSTLAADGGGTIETRRRRHQGEDPADRRQARGPDRRPAQAGAADRGAGRPGLAGRRPLVRRWRRPGGRRPRSSSAMSRRRTTYTTDEEHHERAERDQRDRSCS